MASPGKESSYHARQREETAAIIAIRSRFSRLHAELVGVDEPDVRRRNIAWLAHVKVDHNSSKCRTSTPAAIANRKGGEREDGETSPPVSPALLPEVAVEGGKLQVKTLAMSWRKLIPIYKSTKV